MFTIRYLRLIWIACLAIFINIIKSPEANAVSLVVAQDTLESLDITINNISYPDVDNGDNGEEKLLFDGQYWNVFASQNGKNFGAPYDIRFGTDYVIQQGIPGSTGESFRRIGVPYISFPAGGSLEVEGVTTGTTSLTYERSYPAAFDPFPAAEPVACAAGSPNCVFYTITNILNFAEPVPGIDGYPYQASLRIQGDYQPSESSENVPEPLTILGSLLALGLGKRFLSKPSAKRQAAKTV